MRKQQDAFRKAQELKQMLNNLEKVDDEGRRASLLDTLCSVDDVLSLPVHPSPPGIASGELKVDLLKHQVLHVHIVHYLITDITSRIKRCNGVLSTSTLCLRRRRRTSQFNSGNSVKETRYVVVLNVGNV